jgi:hypothetical protein
MDDVTCLPREAPSNRTLTASGVGRWRFAAGMVFDGVRFD